MGEYIELGMTIDDMYDWLYRLKSELVVYMPKEWHEPMRCSIQDAITFSRKYQMLKADYESRLKADMVAMLVELDLMIDEIPIVTRHGVTGTVMTAQGMRKKIKQNIQQKIDALREVEE